MWTKIYKYLWWILHVQKFAKLGRHSFVNRPLQLRGASNMEVGVKSRIGYKSWLAAVSHVKGIEPSITIGDRVAIGNFNHIYAVGSICIEDEVLTADRVYISDNTHEYTDPNTSVRYQDIKFLKAVRIGKGAWLGENVCVIGANVGQHSVIGANSVVTQDIPDFSVAVGVPAKVIKKYNQRLKQWQKI